MSVPLLHLPATSASSHPLPPASRRVVRALARDAEPRQRDVYAAATTHTDFLALLLAADVPLRLVAPPATSAPTSDATGDATAPDVDMDAEDPAAEAPTPLQRAEAAAGALRVVQEADPWDRLAHVPTATLLRIGAHLADALETIRWELLSR